MPPSQGLNAVSVVEEGRWQMAGVVEEYRTQFKSHAYAKSEEDPSEQINRLEKSEDRQLTEIRPWSQNTENNIVFNSVNSLTFRPSFNGLGSFRYEQEELPGSKHSSLESKVHLSDHPNLQVGISDPTAEISFLRMELKRLQDAHAVLSDEVICLRDNLRSSLSSQSEQMLEINRLRHELEFSNKVKIEQAGKISVLQNMLDAMNSTDFFQLEDFTIRALQVELKAECRRGAVGPHAILMEAPEDYTGCRQFFQTGFCHFGRGRRPCPNVNSHYCLHCGRDHGTAPHLILIHRMNSRSLNAITASHSPKIFS